MSSYQIIRYFV